MSIPNPSSIADKLVDHADIIAGVITFSGDGGIQNVIDLINAGMDNTIHMPDLKLTFQDVIGDVNVVAMATMALGTYVLAQAGVPYMGKVSRVVTKAAVGYGGGKLASRLMFRSAHAGAGSFGPPTSGLSGAHEGVSNAMVSRTGQYNYAEKKVVDPGSLQSVDVFAGVGL